VAEISQASQGALLTIFYTAGPLLAVILIVGVIIGVFLALTQINEPTLSFVPKFLGTGAAIALLGPWLLQRLEDFAISVLANLSQIVQ
jgi:flagellar biosynthetic protein FliQ